MIEAIKFVKGAVAKKDFVPNLTAFQIKDGFIKGFNGELALCCPIPVDVDIAPNAGQFIKALSRCNETDVKLTVTKAGKLAVRSGKVRVLVDAVSADDFPQVAPEGERTTPAGSLLDCLKTLQPFVAIDASKAWSNGVMLKGGFAYATNNVILSQYWLGYECPEPINIPATAIKEILRIGEEPVSISHTSSRLTLHYGDGKWLSTQLLSLEWPDMEKYFSKMPEGGPACSEQLFEALEAIKPFTDELGRVFINEKTISTHEDLENATCVIDVDLPGASGVFSCNQLQALHSVAWTLDLGRWPQPCSFYGESVRGLIVGLVK